jgi:hypothetical protein
MKDRRLVLFVQRLGGASEATWRARDQLGFPELIKSDAALWNEADAAFFEYPTSVLRFSFSRKPPSIMSLADGLRTQIDGKHEKYQSITLVCHSLGGLVARQYLVEDKLQIRYVVAGQDDVVEKQSAINVWGNTNVDTILNASHASIIEAAMAYTRGLPLLVLVERGLQKSLSASSTRVNPTRDHSG